ncbi:MAG: hypothetical protein U5K74_02015 [Gemmatimonadaceae bacterium]|nr:hypothetical protein [Gemmatimonadaceae bacterium]
MAHRATIIIAAAALLAACGRGSANASSGGASADAPADTVTRASVACAAVTPADLDTVFAPRTFVADTTGAVPVIQPGRAEPNAVTSCTYKSGTTVRDLMTITVTLVGAETDATHATVDEMKRAVTKLRLTATPTDVPGLGTAAYWVNLGTASRSSIAVYVEHAPRRWLILGESSSGGTIDATVDRLTDVARRALARM